MMILCALCLDWCNIEYFGDKNDKECQKVLMQNNHLQMVSDVDALRLPNCPCAQNLSS